MKYIILIRHSQAEDLLDGMDDATRSLTEKGKKKLRKISPFLKQKIREFETVSIFSSNLKRSIQSAQILAKRLDRNYVGEQTFLQTGDTEALLDLIREEEVECLILVGHQPYLSEFSKNLSGLDLPFETCACACFSIDEDEFNLEWFAQPHWMMRHAKA
jgi:phosphohistidine phosphatase